MTMACRSISLFPRSWALAVLLHARRPPPPETPQSAEFVGYWHFAYCGMPIWAHIGSGVQCDQLVHKVCACLRRLVANASCLLRARVWLSPEASRAGISARVLLAGSPAGLRVP